MTVYLVPGPFGAGLQVFDQNGRSVTGALVYQYAAGTTSPVATFTTATGNVTAANPVVTSADGRMPYELWQPGGQAIKIVVTDSLGNSLGGPYDNLQGINDPAFSSLLTTTNTWRALQNISSINASSIWVGNISVTSGSVSNLNVSNLTVSSVSRFLGAVNMTKGADITASNAIDIATPAGNFFDITGTNAIASLGTVTAGAIRYVRFSSAPPLTYNATSLILPGAGNIATSAGDVATLISLGAGNWQCINYTRFSGGNQNIQAFTGSGTFTPIVTGTHTIILGAGGGGGGLTSGGSGANSCGGGGGGGAGQVRIFTQSLTAGTPYTVTIGSSGASATAGGNSTFDATTVTGGSAGSNGGTPGAGGGGNQGGSSSGGSGGSGASSGTSTRCAISGAGAAGGAGAAAAAGGGGGGAGGHSIFGAGGAGGTGGSSNNVSGGVGSAASASSYCAGGGGAGGGGSDGGTGGNSGGAGGGGICIVIW